ncbi:hypothetical protein HPP92_023206 [Vanilla planifolia]|uniref:non-specific serine/threonine protein kinase n=1 Tax=Vanilla planifolia TaxID=51239 RepID=A0A835UCM4_VANPL|nr:hypothetical protein HPP92_023206 [Vanilla planifolia]
MRRLYSFPLQFCVVQVIEAIATLILHVGVISQISGGGAALSPDGLALLAFKSAVSGDPNSALASWDEDDTDPCRWPGVSCANFSSSDSRVVAIAVTGKNLSGYIPSEIGSLTYLRRLNLHGNLLSGPIPSELFNATSLHSLFLYDNNFSGPIPESLCDPPRLQNIDLSRNSLGGPLPSDLGACRQLQRLLLAGNNLSGLVAPGIWPQLVGLVQLDISSNTFEGPLPPDIGDLDSLSGTLNLSHNHFSGPIPKSLGNLPPAVNLDLRYNNFSGEIPQTGSLTNQGPTAFLNNPGLCGFPLRIQCQDGVNPASPAPPGREVASPETESPPEKRKDMRPGLIVLISMADAAGVAFIGLVAVYIYWKVKDKGRGNGCSCTGKSRLGGGGEGCGGRQCGKCWRTGFQSSADENEGEDMDEAESSLEEEAGEGKLVAMDRGFEFELDELLRASAYVLGKGGLGIVYKVVLGNGVPVAVRRLGEGGGQRYKEFAAEVQAIAKARHPNVVRLRAYYWAQDEKLLISDFISNGNLSNALRGRSTQLNLTWSIRLRIARGMARGLAYLHDCSTRKFIHGDIKPSNILLDSDYNSYISDLGLNRLVSIASTNSSAVILPSSLRLPPRPPPPGSSAAPSHPQSVRPTAGPTHMQPQRPEYRFPARRRSGTSTPSASCSSRC